MGMVLRRCAINLLFFFSYYYVDIYIMYLAYHNSFFDELRRLLWGFGVLHVCKYANTMSRETRSHMDGGV